MDKDKKQRIRELEREYLKLSSFARRRQKIRRKRLITKTNTINILYKPY